MERKANAEDNEKRKGFMHASSIGIEFSAAVFLFAFLGYWADNYFKTAPWLMALGVIIGAIAGFWNVFRIVLKDLK